MDEYVTLDPAPLPPGARQRRTREAWILATVLALAALAPADVLGWACIGLAVVVALLSVVDAGRPGRPSGWIAALTGSRMGLDIVVAAVQWWTVGLLAMAGLLLMGVHSVAG